MNCCEHARQLSQLRNKYVAPRPGVYNPPWITLGDTVLTRREVFARWHTRVGGYDVAALRNAWR